MCYYSISKLKKDTIIIRICICHPALECMQSWPTSSQTITSAILQKWINDMLKLTDTIVLTWILNRPSHQPSAGAEEVFHHHCPWGRDASQISRQLSVQFGMLFSQGKEDHKVREAKTNKQWRKAMRDFTAISIYALEY